MVFKHDLETVNDSSPYSSIGRQNARVRCKITMSDATPPNLAYSALKALKNFMRVECIHNPRLGLLPELFVFFTSFYSAFVFAFVLCSAWVAK